LDKILKASGGKLKMMTIAPELKGASGIIKKLKKEKVIASFGHSNATYEETKKGIAAGITHATHIFNAMRPIHHRDPGPLPALLTDDRISVQLIADGVHIRPEIVRLILKLKGAENICLITDSMSSMGLPDGKYAYDGWGYESKNGVCRYKDGTLIGTALPLNKMVRRMIEFGGIGLQDALKMVTINPAKALGIHNRKGSIGEGKDADLVIMDEDLDVEVTIVGGEVVYRRKKRSLGH
jgi:N-acetylglucosamine-6-phosphate deacetylase